MDARSPNRPTITLQSILLLDPTRTLHRPRRIPKLAPIRLPLPRPEGHQVNDINELLEAVDALTRPVTAVTFVGTAHAHEWHQVKRSLTPDELAALKKSKGKLVKEDRETPTGQHWCRWCDAVVDQVPAPDDGQAVNRRDDAPLLEQLTERVRSTLSDGGGSSTAGAGVLIDVAAFDMFDAIDGRLRSWITIELGGKVGKGLTLLELLRSWYVLYASSFNGIGDDQRRQRVLEGWATSIRDILDPPDQVPYMGQPCPICGETRALRGLAGEVEDTVALWAILRPSYRSEGSYGICRACDQILARDTDPMTLRAKMNGAITPATHLTQSIADAVKSA